MDVAAVCQPYLHLATGPTSTKGAMVRQRLLSGTVDGNAEPQQHNPRAIPRSMKFRRDLKLLSWRERIAGLARSPISAQLTVLAASK